MSLIEWKDSLSVKIPSIDAQHKKLVEIINELHDAMLKGKSKEILDEVLDSLIKYTNEHFTYEENLFVENNYPDKDKHAEQHKKFVDKLNEVQERAKKITAFISIEIMDFLRDWLSNHIMGSDQKYSEYLKSQGVT